MRNLHHILLLICTVTTTIAVSVAFNIDTTQPEIYEGKGDDFFGYRVLQFDSSRTKGVLVSAPLQQNGTGEICRYVQSKGDCFSPTDFSTRIKDLVSLKHFGMSLTKKTTHSERHPSTVNPAYRVESGSFAGAHRSAPRAGGHFAAGHTEFTVCSPSLAHECHENHYLNSVCVTLDDQLQPLSNITPTFQECTKRTVDLVFLFDGSSSMTADEFDENKHFIKDIMKNLQNSSIKFAAVQFSKTFRTVFDFNDYQKGKAQRLLDEEKHMMDLTNTYMALSFVLKSLFENQTAGASLDAVKVLVVITDGNPSDIKKPKVIQQYDSKGIIRLVIGVKVDLKGLHDIASEPKINNTFPIKNYRGLRAILENFQNKIFNIEGSKMSLAGNLGDEMSQSGFSAIYHKDTLVLGAVGSNMWRGSLYELHGSEQKAMQIQDLHIQNCSYLGYSLAAGENNNVTLYFAGAPRFEHIGQVVVFKQESSIWKVAQRLNGEQIGSYFGAEMSTLDIDSDMNIDFLLVGAPLFYQPHEKREGLVYIYTMTDELELKRVMTVSGASQGRFGSTISSLADLNGDDLRDVAVGAPLEDDNTGAVYIYLGDKHRGIRDNFSQRIMAKTISSQIRFFGQAVDGNIDLGDDGLTDIVVGSRGHAVVLRSRPVLSASAYLSFGPSKIGTDNLDCMGSIDVNQLMVVLKVCFDVTELTHSKAGALSTGVNISFTLDVDPMRQTSRGFFSETDTGARQLQSIVELRDRNTCFNHYVYMQNCVKDTLSPVLIRLKFSQHEPEKATSILNVDNVLQSLEVPFEKNCIKNDTCIAELETDFKFVTPTLLIVDQNYFNVSVTLTNHGDDSYNTSLTLYYPPGLSFSMMNVMEATRLTICKCNDLQDAVDETTCGISLPVYRSRTSATFMILFRIIGTYDWNNTMTMTIIGQSDNNNSTSGNMTKTIPVQFQVDLAVSVDEDTVTYLNFTPEDSKPKRVVNVFEVRNLGSKALPINVSLVFPTRLEHNFEMKNYQVSGPQNQTQCREMADTVNDFCSYDQSCKSITCRNHILDKTSTMYFVLSGDVVFRDLQEHVANVPFLNRFTGQVAEVVLKSLAEVRYDDQLYVPALRDQEMSEAPTTFPTAQIDMRVELIIAPDKRLIIGASAGGGLLLLILITVAMFKMGCFKRKTLQDYEEQDKVSLKGDQFNPPGATGPGSQSGTDSQSDAAGEAKLLLNSSECGEKDVPAGRAEE